MTDSMTEEKWILPQAPSAAADFWANLERTGITSQEQLSWALRKIGEAQKKASDAQRLYDIERARIDVWLERAQASHIQTADKLRKAAEAYAIALREETEGEEKSVSTPYGVVSTKETAGGWQITEEGTAVVAALFPDAVDHKVNLPKLKKLVRVVNGVVQTETGYPISGVSIAPTKVSATVQLR